MVETGGTFLEALGLELVGGSGSHVSPGTFLGVGVGPDCHSSTHPLTPTRNNTDMHIRARLVGGSVPLLGRF